MADITGVPTGLLSMGSGRLATVVNQMMVMPEFNTKEKNRFLWSVILWQLRVLQTETERERGPSEYK